ncbi:MAG TPA: oligosaccharide flippase family protein, partial [Chloroflexota bacterium]
AFLLTALGQDYYPRVSAVSDQPAALRELVNRQHRFIMLLGVPIILVALALVPTLIPLVYTSHFLPASDVLEWMLIGDIFKLGSWTMGYVILARSRSSTLLVTEGITGAAWLAGGWIGIAWLGLTGIGVAYLVAYIVHLAAVWVVVRREIGFVWDSENFWLMAAAVLAAGVIRGLPLVGLTQIRTPVALCLGAAATAYSAYVIYHELGGVRRVRAA